MENEQIVKLYFQRDQQAITATARKYASYCHSIAYRILENHPDAEGVVNDTHLGPWNSIPPTRPVSLPAYFRKISRRLALNRWRSHQTKKRGGGETALALEELADCIPWGRSAQAELEGKELEKSVNRFVRELPLTEQRIFVLRYWHLFPIRAIAEKYQISESKVKSQLSRTRKKLGNYLEKEGLL